MKRRIAALLMVVAFLLATAAPAAFAQGASCEPGPGGSEGSRSIQTTPPQTKLGAVAQDPEANEHDTGTTTGRGERCL
jgi:hypothetical protein